jgi:class 3 adenylate cyclase
VKPSIRVRIGVHTGEFVQEADDFYGLHVNFAARSLEGTCGRHSCVIIAAATAEPSRPCSGSNGGGHDIRTC